MSASRPDSMRAVHPTPADVETSVTRSPSRSAFSRKDFTAPLASGAFQGVRWTSSKTITKVRPVCPRCSSPAGVARHARPGGRRGGGLFANLHRLEAHDRLRHAVLEDGHVRGLEPGDRSVLVVGDDDVDDDLLDLGREGRSRDLLGDEGCSSG